MGSSTEAARGRFAERPQDIPARGWWDVVVRVAKRLGTDNVSLIAGGVAMYLLLSVFPGLAALVSLYGLFANPADVARHMQMFSGVLPPGVWDIFNSQLQGLVHRGQGTLGIGAAFGILVALWSSRSAMSSLMTAANVAYGEREKRGFFVQILLSLAFTAAALVGFLAMLTIGIVIPAALTVLGASPVVKIAASVVRFVLLWCMAAVGFAVIYRYAPAREHARWRWVTWGSAIAATLWIAASALFSFYVHTFASYGKTYGALGGVVVLLMWFYISSFVVVLGAEINAEMERQTRKDTTVRQDAPLGQRGAYAADTVGPDATERKQPQHFSEGKNQIAGK